MPYSFPFRLHGRSRDLTASAAGAVGLVRSKTASPPVGYRLPKDVLTALYDRLSLMSTVFGDSKQSRPPIGRKTTVKYEKRGVAALLTFLRLPFRRQNSALPVVRANGMTSRMFCIPVRYMISLSKPRPNPACFTPPKRLRSRYHQ